MRSGGRDVKASDVMRVKATRPKSYDEAISRLPVETAAGAGRWLTTREVAQVLGISRQGVFWLVSCGQIKGRKARSGVAPGGHCYARSDVTKMLRQRFIVAPERAKEGETT